MKETKFSVKKKILASASMLTVSAIMLSSATYAWFSINKQVSVTGIDVGVKSNSTYLLIGSDDDGKNTLALLQATNQTETELNITALQSRVYPADYVGATDDTQTNLTDADDVEDTDTAEVPGNWYFRVADAPTASGSTTAATALTSTNFGDYVIHRKVYVTLKPGSESATNLVITGSTFDSDSTVSTNDATFDPVRVLVTSSTAAVELDSAHTSSNTALSSTVTDQSLVELDLWIFYDGNDADVFTTNKANLDGAEVEIQFGVTYSSELG